jgi:hypothetical protein
MPESIAPGGGSPAVSMTSAGRRASLVVITPCCRPEFLRYVHHSVRLSIVTRWIIVFDAEQVPQDSLPDALLHNPQVTLTAIKSHGSRYGNVQRHLGLQIARALYQEDDPFIYFLDDDNVVHPAFYDLFHRFMWRRGVFYTFNQRRAWLTCYGKPCVRLMMDTAMICLPLSFCPDWNGGSSYAEDYYFVKSVMSRHGNRHVYLNHVAAYYNALQPRAVTRLVGSRQGSGAIIATIATVSTLAVALRLRRVSIGRRQRSADSDIEVRNDP